MRDIDNDLHQPESALAATNNGPALAAITEAPAILTGVSAEHQVRFRDSIYNIHAKAERDEETALSEAFNAAISAVNVAGALAHDLKDPVRLAEIERGVSAAAEAEAAFNTQ